jgi:hypothetical protein
MFILAHLPIADLRSLTPAARSRLSVPDWTQDDPGKAFMRGFGRVAARNLPSLGMAGERAFADFGQAARFRGPITYRQSGWPQAILIEPWFRRFYFDGVCAGRFEFGFLVRDDVEDNHFADGLAGPYDPRAIASEIARTRLLFRGADLPGQELRLAEAGDALGLAYLAATTRRAALDEFPLSETLGREVAVGRASIHVRIAGGKAIARSRDRRKIVTPAGKGLFLTVAAGSVRRGSVLVQLSDAASMDETDAERAVRVLFSHLNSLIYALGHCLRLFEQKHKINIDRTRILQVVKDALQKLRTFAPTGPTDSTDDGFAIAIQTFAKAYEGRLDELVDHLQHLAEDLNKPGSAARVLGYLQSLVELIITTGVKASIEAAVKATGR